VAFLIGVLGAPLGVAAGVGGVTAIASVVLNARWQRRVHADARESGEVLFPSPGGP
jgi:hypothetical protein